MGTNYDASMQCFEETAVKNPHEELKIVPCTEKMLNIWYLILLLLLFCFNQVSVEFQALSLA